MFFNILLFIIFAYNNILFSQSSNALSNNTIMSKENSKIKDISRKVITNKHSISLDFGPTLTSVGYLNIANLFVKQPDGVQKKMFSGTFGIGFNYHYILVEKIDLEAHLGINTFLFYFYEGFHPPMPNIDFGVDKPGEVDKYFLTRFVDIPISFGARFYLTKNKNSRFFITPKVGGNIILSMDKVETMRISINNPDGSKDFLYRVETNQNVFNAALFVSAEIGFRIDINIKKLNDKGIKPFFDISIIDLGYYIFPYYSKKYVFGESEQVANSVGQYAPLLNLRVVPLPKIAFGVSF